MTFTFVTKSGAQQVPVEKRQERPIKAAVRGTAEGLLGAYGNLTSLIPGYPTGQVYPGLQAQHQLESQANDYQLAGLAGDNDVAPIAANAPNSTQIDELLTKIGIPKEEKANIEKFAGRFGRLFGGGLALTGQPGLSASTAGTGGAAGQVAEQLGFGPTAQSLAEIGGSLRLGGGASKGPATQIRQPRAVTKGINPKEAGIITQERFNQQINRVNKEAAEIAETIGENHPKFQRISAAIDSGKPIREKFTRMFNQLEATAQQANVPIKSDKLNSFLQKESNLYQGTGAPTDLSKFVTGEIQGWQNGGQDNLYNMYRRYRLNNQRVSELIQTMPPGKLRSQQIGFLTKMNDAIKDSFHDTFSTNRPSLPGQGGTTPAQDWLNAFEASNSAYSDFLNTEATKKILDPLMKKELSGNQLGKFLKNQNNWEDLRRFLGEEDAQTLRVTLEDLDKAHNALNKMNKLEVGQEVLKVALAAKIPGLGTLSSLLSLPKAIRWLQGRYNSGHAFQQSFSDLANGLSEKNGPAIKRAVDELNKQKEKEEKSKQKSLIFIPNK